MRTFMLGAAMTIAAFLSGQTVQAAPAGPTCQGRSLVQDLRERDPARLEAALARARAEFPNLDGRLYRVERPGTAPSYLFGTMHSADPRIGPLPEALRAALASTRLVAVELEDAVMTGPRGDALAQRMIADAIHPAGGTIDFLSQDERSALESAGTERGIPAAALNALHPWFLNLVLALPPCDIQRTATVGIEQSVDGRVIAERAASSQLISLETVDEQLEAVRSQPDTLARRALSLAARYASRSEDLFATMVELYATGRIGAYPDILLAAGIGNEDDRTLTLDFIRHLCEGRNRIMAERALPHLEGGNAVIAVGALHLYDRGGLVERLRAAGYTVTRID